MLLSTGVHASALYPRPAAPRPRHNAGSARRARMHAIHRCGIKTQRIRRDVLPFDPLVRSRSRSSVGDGCVSNNGECPGGRDGRDWGGQFQASKVIQLQLRSHYSGESAARRFAQLLPHSLLIRLSSIHLVLLLCVRLQATITISGVSCASPPLTPVVQCMLRWGWKGFSPSHRA